MPQFDFLTYFTQFFTLSFSICLFYLFYLKFFLQYSSEIFKFREKIKREKFLITKKTKNITVYDFVRQFSN